jgi:hypothetical protein
MLSVRLIITALLLLPLRAAAQTAQPSVEVQAEYKKIAGRAVSEFEAEHFAEARRLFEQAHRLWPSARTLRTLGMTAFDLERYPEALEELQAALNDPRRPLVGDQRTEVEALLERTRDHVGSFSLTLLPATAELTVDGVARPHNTDQKLVLRVGEHALRVQAVGFRTLRRSLDVHVRQDEPLRLELEPEAPPTAAVQSAQKLPEAPAQALSSAPATPQQDSFALVRGIAFAAGAVGLATAVTAGLLALDRSRVVGDECNDRSQCTQKGLDAASAGRTWMIVSDVGTAVGVLGFSGWLLLPGGLLNGRPDDRGAALVVRGQFL